MAYIDIFWRNRMKQGEWVKSGIQLDLAREEILDLIGRELQHHEHVMAYFYESPKHSVNRQEIYLCIVVQPAFYEDFIKQKRSLVANWGSVLFYDEDYYISTQLTVYYDNLVKLGLKLFEPKDLKPSIHYKEIEVVYDPYGLMEYVSEVSDKSAVHLNYELLDNWRCKFFASYYDFYRSIKSQESYQIQHELDVMRWLIATMWLLRSGKRPNHYLNWSRIEGQESVLSAEEQVKLKSWQMEDITEGFQEVVNLILNEFKVLHRELCEQLDIIEDEGFIERILTRIQME